MSCPVADGFAKRAAPLTGDDPLLQYKALWDDLPCAWGGAVGRVVAVGTSHAKVRLLNDPNSGAAAEWWASAPIFSEP